VSSLRIAEIFHSLQGEGSLVGVPSTFIRVSGCNLRCVWCDTPYASWNPEGPVMPVGDILGQVRHRHVVLTGGEPMLFDAIEPLCQELAEQGIHVTIETAGTVFRKVACDLMSISPKLANSTPPESSGWASRHEATRLDRTALQQLIEAYEVQLKFVVTDPSEINEIEGILSGLPLMDQDRIMLMAEGVDADVLRQRQKELVPICLERGWRLTPRWHVDLFGNTRGT